MEKQRNEEMEKNSEKNSIVKNLNQFLTLNPFNTLLIIVFLILLTLSFIFKLGIIQVTRIRSSEIQSGFFDLETFQFKIQQKSCAETGTPDLLVIIFSKADHFEERKTIRDTWGNVTMLRKHGPIRLLFVLGEISCSNIVSEIVKESLQYEDILVGTFEETYHHLPYKSLMMFRWYINYCPHAKLLLKADDDTFINTPAILESFKTDHWTKVFTKDPLGLVCYIFYDGAIFRDVNHRYYVPEEQIKGNIFPPLCYGPAIFYNIKTATIIYEASRSIKPPYVWIDDALITGVVRSKTNVTLTDINGKYRATIGVVKSEMIINGTSKKFFVGPYGNEPKDIRELWKAVVGNMNRNHSLVSIP